MNLVGWVVLPEADHTRPPGWSGGTLWLVALVGVTATGAWPFPRVRASAFLIGALCITLLAMQHSMGTPDAPPPAAELFTFYGVAAVLLAAGTWEWARHPDGRDDTPVA